MSARMNELREMDEADLRKELHEVQRALFGLRVQISNQASENTAGLGKLKREIAQVKTVLRAKAGGEGGGKEVARIEDKGEAK